MAVMAAAHSPATFATSAGGGLGRDERGGADGGESGRSENRLADYGFSPGFMGMCLHILAVSRANGPGGSTAQR
jgi:hypothetical protein